MAGIVASVEGIPGTSMKLMSVTVRDGAVEFENEAITYADITVGMAVQVDSDTGTVYGEDGKQLSCKPSAGLMMLAGIGLPPGSIVFLVVDVEYPQG
jgi:hypothetical protein